MKQTILDDIMAKVESFPSMPGAATKLLTVLDDPDISPTQIEEIIRLDPGITANILKLTNSAYFGFASKIGSIRQAVILLGAKELVKIVTASCVNAAMNSTILGYDLPPGELWKHSIAVSIVAESLAKELNCSEIHEIFTAALLHDVGKLVLGDFVKKDLHAIETETSTGVPFHVAERSVLGTDHAEIGAKILDSWSFPPQIVKAVRWHHDPDSADDTNRLIDIVHVANVLCLMIGVGVGREGLNYEPSPLATKRLGITANYLEAVASKALQWINELSDDFESNL